MKIFPTKNYEFELTKDSLSAMSELKNNTLISDSLTSEWTKKAFIGQVNEKGFKIISSKPGRGAFCVLEGKIKSQNGSLEIRIHKAFRIMLSIIYLFPLIGFSIALFTEETKAILSLIIPTLMFIIVFRFIFTELAFRLISKNGLNKLTEIIGITKLNKNEAQQRV
ncbi:hypothetical protein [Psychroserpens ponticola]|uniref:Uncharacterized protein n=1 Tax=Psychroserpens ponticola TaxID=2932268 RepID=A0ABY7S2K2_9FLAO|nr:hypothetical protein [Psychroserpens ponticola]WCO03625.1 hypothetical protein MUN68_008960 [Psychroserpens ponticola]